MTGHQINSLVGDLVAMAQSMERLPTVEAELSEVKGALEQSRQTVQDRELAIIRYKEQIETLRAKINDVEASRDDAELRFLEADERTTRALDFVKNMFGSAGALVQQLEPPVALPEPQAQTNINIEGHWDNSGQHHPVVESASPLPTIVQVANTPSHSVSSSAPMNATSERAESEHRAESAPDPTHDTAPPQTVDASPSPVTMEGIASSSEPQPAVGPYHGKRYHDLPQYVSFDRWIEGGGTYEDYYPAALASSIA